MSHTSVWIWLSGHDRVRASGSNTFVGCASARGTRRICV